MTGREKTGVNRVNIEQGLSILSYAKALSIYHTVQGMNHVTLLIKLLQVKVNDDYRGRPNGGGWRQGTQG